MLARNNLQRNNEQRASRLLVFLYPKHIWDISSSIILRVANVYLQLIGQMFNSWMFGLEGVPELPSSKTKGGLFSNIPWHGLPVIHGFGGKSGCKWLLGPRCGSENKKSKRVIQVGKKMFTWMCLCMIWHDVRHMYIIYIYMIVYTYRDVYGYMNWLWLDVNIYIYIYMYTHSIQVYGIWHTIKHHLGKLFSLTATATATSGYKLDCQISLVDRGDFLHRVWFIDVHSL